jgi:hypothetical protein
MYKPLGWFVPIWEQGAQHIEIPVLRKLMSRNGTNWNRTFLNIHVTHYNNWNYGKHFRILMSHDGINWNLWKQLV